MSTLRKYQRQVIKPKKSRLTAESSLLIGCIALVGIGFAQPALMSIAFNDSEPAPNMIAQSRNPTLAANPAADYTPVGAIDRKPPDAQKSAPQPSSVPRR